MVFDVGSGLTLLLNITHASAKLNKHYLARLGEYGLVSAYLKKIDESGLTINACYG